MATTLEEIERLIIATVCDIQQQSGRPIPESVNPTLRPIGDFEGFDSINGVEVTVHLSERLGLDIKGNPFVDVDRALNVKEAAKQIHKLSQTKGAESK